MNDVKTDISLITSVSKKLTPMIRAQDQVVADKLNELSDQDINFVYDCYKDNAAEGNFKALRFIVADMLKNGAQVDLHQINALKQKFCDHDIAFFAKNYPDMQNLVRKSRAELWYAFPGNLFKQLHPLFWYTKKDEVERAFRRICYYIDTHIDGFSSYDKHIITFDGIQGSPQSDIYCSWYPKNKLNYSRAYQLFIRIKHNGISAGIWRGSNVTESFENQEIECGDDIEKVIKVLQDSKSVADSLNSGKKVAPQQFSLEELLQYFVESALLVRERLQDGDNHNFSDLSIRHGNYSSLIEYKTSFGQGSLAFVPWISFCGFGQKTTKGIYPVVLFNTQAADAGYIEFCYGLSVTEKPDVEWDERFVAGLKHSATPNYATSFCKKSYKISSIEDFEANKTEMVECLKGIIKDYETQFSNKTIETESEGLKQMPIVQHKPTRSLNTILYGCPGTGKTYNTIVRAIEILEPEIIEWADDGHNVKNYARISEKFDEYVNDGRVKFITFHQSYSYEEFVEGIKPEIVWGSSAKDLKYVGKDGIFKEFCNQARQDRENPYVLIIDEINRGNISKIFGELITLIEEDKRETLSTVLPYSQQEFTVPKNLYIIGTMNTADRSILSIDIALRRRFSFIEQEPEENLISFKYNGFDLGAFVAQLNRKISMLIDKDHQLGHSEFMKIDNIAKLREVWFTKTLPLLNEYLYGDWEKLMALVPNFINKTQVTDTIIKDLSGDFYYWFKKNSEFATDDEFINALTM